MMVWQRQAVDAGIRGARALAELVTAVEKLTTAVEALDVTPKARRDVVNFGVMYEHEAFELAGLEALRPEGSAVLVLTNPDAHDEPPNWEELAEIEVVKDGYELVLAQGRCTVQHDEIVTWVAVDTRRP